MFDTGSKLLSTFPLTLKLPAVMLPVAEINPPVNKLPPVTFAVTDTVVPVCVVALTFAPPNTLPAVILPVAEINPPVKKLAAVLLPVLEINPLFIRFPLVTLPVAEINPPVRTLPPVMLPVALTTPVTYSPVVAYTTTLLVPPIDMLALPPLVPILASLVPLNILEAKMPEAQATLPKK